MDQYDTIGSVTNAPFVFSFYENNTRYERCFVDAAYLAASIDAVLLQHIRKTHSMRIVYNSIEFTSYQKKVWYNTEESFCKKVPLKCSANKSVSFNPLISGEFPGENVNTNANIMFTADFKNTQGVFYRTNRFITCTAFATQADIQDLSVRNLWHQLETGFSSPVVLSTYPLVGLIQYLVFLAERLFRPLSQFFSKDWSAMGEMKKAGSFRKYLTSLLPFGQPKNFIKFFVNDLLDQFSLDLLTIESRKKFLKKLETPSLRSNLFLYSRTLTDYYYNLNKQFYGLDYNDNLLFETIVENLCRELLKNNEISVSFLLYEKIYEIFISHLIWKNEKSIYLGERKTSGIYIIYNKESLITYVGESNNIERRFFQHYNSLLEGCHYNKGLQKACSLYGIDSFVFLVVQYCDIYKDLVFRRETEIKLINSWPSTIYNIKDVNHLYRKKFHKYNC